MLGRLGVALFGLGLGLAVTGCAEHAATRACTNEDLQPDRPARAGMIFQSAGTGSGEGVIHFKNIGQRVCTVVGQPRARLIGTPGAPRAAQGPARLDRGSVAVQRLSPGSDALVRLEWSNWCGRGSNGRGRSGPMPRGLVILLRGRTLGRFSVNGAPACYQPRQPSFIAVTTFFRVTSSASG